MAQGSQEWKDARLGKATASRMDAVCSKGRGSAPSLTRAAYMAELLTERLTGVPYEGFVSADMRWGTEREPEAKLAYEVATGRLVTTPDFIPHPIIDMSGASPDGFVTDRTLPEGLQDGLVEVKCPRTHTHLAYLRAGVPPADYVQQMAWQIACTGRTWCDFVSFDPRLPEDIGLFVVRYIPEPAFIESLERQASQFLAELHEQELEIRAWRTTRA